MLKNKSLIYAVIIIAVLSIGYYQYHKYHFAPNLEIDNIHLSDLQGHDAKLSDFKGKTVFVNFWGTWCGPCVREMPSIYSASLLFKDKNIVFLTVSDEDMNVIADFKARSGFTMTFLKLKGGINDIGVFSIPTTYIIAPSGAIVFKETGSRDWANAESTQLISSFTDK